MLPFLLLLLSNSNYIKYYSYVIIDKDNKHIVYLYNCLKELHDKYNTDITLDDYCLYTLNKYNNSDKEVIEHLLNELKTIKLNEQMVLELLQDMRDKQLAHQLTLTAIGVTEGKRPVQDIHSVLAQFDKPLEHQEDAFVSDNLQELYDDAVKSKGLRWRLNTLNRMLGSLRRGDFGFIFARPETGKTTFLASEVTHFATQTKSPILWFNNEEAGNKVMLRCYQAMLGITQTQLFGDVDGNTSRFMELGGGRIKIFDSAAISKRQVEQLVEQHQPGLVVFDQLDKIKGFDGDRDDLRLGSIYIWAREIAKGYCPVIAVSQADASGEGKKYLTMDNVAGAKTAKQAEADWILGIGKTHNDAEEYTRFLNISKNKLAGDPDTDPERRHGKAQVIIEPIIARYVDVEEY